MTTDTKSPQPASIVMPHGIQSDPAQALASACGVPMQPFDLAALTQFLAAGQRCVVVWSSPQSAVAQALRSQTPPSEMVAQWRQSVETLLKLFGRFRRKLLLVDARVIMQGKAEDLANLARRLPMQHALVAPGIVPDLPDLLAQVMVDQLADLRSVFDELQASSLSIAQPARTSTDLDPVAKLLSALTDDRTRLADDLEHLATRHQEEGDLHRDVLADLSRSLVQKATALEEAESRLAETAQRAERSDNESNLLREQLRDVSEVSAASLSSQADQITAAAQKTAMLEHDAAFLREELASLSDAYAAVAAELVLATDRADLSAELDLARAQLQSMSQLLAQSDAAASRDMAAIQQSTSAEIALLREQLVALNAELNTQATAAPSFAGLDYPQIEGAFAALLASLSNETELRKAAQQQSLSTARTMQMLTAGIDHLPMRGPIPPRPQTAAVLPLKNVMK